MTEECLQWTALELSARLHRRDLSCRELMLATLRRLDAVNPGVNAIVSRVAPEVLLAQADERDAQLARGESMGWLHGIPQAIKDMAPVAGLPNTMGSPLLARNMPAQDGLLARRTRAAGAIFIGKTNVPEFGLGSHTFNEVFGPTRNAWDPGRSAGGSSGGAAVALATRMLCVADGSDFMGSLRNPAAWAHVYGLRPSQGRVPMWPAQDAYLSQLGTEGPMARTVADLRALLSTQSGHDARVPLSLAQPATAAVRAPGSALPEPRGIRIGWLADLDGYLPMEPGLLDLCEQSLARLQALGCAVEPIRLGFSPERVWDAWLVWRAVLVAARIAPMLALPGARQRIKPEALWEHDSAAGPGQPGQSAPGRAMDAARLMGASAVRTQFHQHMVGLLGRYDALALPVTQVWPFDVNERWPRRIGSREMDTYHRWMEVVIYATFAGLPAISVPAGFGGPGPRLLPAGLQLIGRPLGDEALLDLAELHAQTMPDLLAMAPG